MPVSKLDALDRQLSRHIIHLDSKEATWLLFPFSSVFHPKMIWIPVAAVFYLSGWKLYDVAIYLLGMLVCLVCTTLLKRQFKRPRPDLLEKVRKSKRFRIKEKNCAMPSGDTVQSMFFSMVMVMWYGVDPGIMLIFHVLVAVSRVYFMCHWLGDTIAASIITYPIGLLFLWIHSTGLRSYQPTLNNLL